MKQTEWYLLSFWKACDVESVTQKQISKSDPLRECKGPYKKKVLIKLNTSFLLIFNLLLLGLWLSYWMWFQSWWKNNLFWLSRWENFFLWSQHSSCDEDNRGSLCSMHRCCLPPHLTAGWQPVGGMGRLKFGCNIWAKQFSNNSSKINQRLFTIGFEFLYSVIGLENSVESTLGLFWFCFSTLNDWSKEFLSACQSIRFKNKN